MLRRDLMSYCVSAAAVQPMRFSLTWTETGLSLGVMIKIICNHSYMISSSFRAKAQHLPQIHLCFVLLLA